MISRSLLFLVVLSCHGVSAQSSTVAQRGLTDHPGTLLIQSDPPVRLTFYSPDIVRVDFLPFADSKIDSSFVVIQQPPGEIPLSVGESDPFLCATSKLRIRIARHPLRLSFSDTTGRVLLADVSLDPVPPNGPSRTVRFRLDPKEHFYGTGERGILDLRGERFESYNTQRGGYETPLPTMNVNVPLLCSTNGYALYIDNTYRGVFDLGKTDSTTFSYTAAGGEISLYFLAGRTIPDQLAAYTWLTGRQPLPPRWAFGFIQSKNRYANETEVRAIARTLRDRAFPCDAIVLDLAWFTHMGDLSWDTAAWPTHRKLVDELLAGGLKTILITEPYIVQPSSGFAPAAANGFLATDSLGNPYLMERWWSCRGCAAALLDMTNPKAREWWWSRHPEAFGSSVAGIWTDLGEPERHPEGMRHYLGSAGKVHNIYNLLWARTIFDGFNALRPGKRVMNLTRSGFAGIQRYGVLTWSGDVARSFGGLAVQLPLLLNMGMSGIAYHSSDLGGYARMPTTPELYTRWMEFGMFTPTARAHGAGENVRGFPTEPWRFGPEAERISRAYIQLRYALLPYIYTLAFQNYSTGIPLARPMFFADSRDPKLMNDASSYLWGDAFLVSPVVEAGAREKRLYLPKGEWVNFWTDEVVAGGESLTVAAPLDRLPLFVRAGSIIPTAPVREYVDQRPQDTLVVKVYPAPDSAAFTMYEDDGESLQYQRGAFAQTTFSQKRMGSDLTLTAGEAKGSFTGQVTRRTIMFEVHRIPNAPRHVTIGTEEVAAFDGLNELRRTGAGFRYDPDRHIVYIQKTESVNRQVDVRISGGFDNRSKSILRVQEGFTGQGRLTPEWKEAIQQRHSHESLERIAQSTKAFTDGESGWAARIRECVPVWSGMIDSLRTPFVNISPPDTVIILVGNQGGTDAFTFGPSTICFDCSQLHSLYGEASSEENHLRIDRFFAHEFTHLLHKAWAERHEVHLRTPLDYALWECLAEGLGNYRSLSEKWIGEKGELTAHARAVLSRLEPVFVQRLAALERAPEREVPHLLEGLSMGPFDQKWGALPVALWLAREAKGDDRNLRRWVDAGPGGVLELAWRNLPDALKEKLPGAP